jgi:hypothetical protein
MTIADCLRQRALDAHDYEEGIFQMLNAITRQNDKIIELLEKISNRRIK